MFEIIADIVTGLCVLALFTAVMINFALNTRPRAFTERRSPVATASMVGFALLLYLTIRLRWGMLPLVHQPLWLALRGLGLATMVTGTGFNLWGRLFLRANWSDHVRIYDDQQLVTHGPYHLVRHPLYASLIWMFFGASLAYLNPLAALENALIFIPAMRYRSNLEERALQETFGEPFTHYQQNTGRFFPRFNWIRTRRSHA